MDRGRRARGRGHMMDRSYPRPPPVHPVGRSPEAGETAPAGRGCAVSPGGTRRAGGRACAPLRRAAGVRRHSRTDPLATPKTDPEETAYVDRIVVIRVAPVGDGREAGVEAVEAGGAAVENGRGGGFAGARDHRPGSAVLGGRIRREGKLSRPRASTEAAAVRLAAGSHTGRALPGARPRPGPASGRPRGGRRGRVDRGDRGAAVAASGGGAARRAGATAGPRPGTRGPRAGKGPGARLLKGSPRWRDHRPVPRRTGRHRQDRVRPGTGRSPRPPVRARLPGRRREPGADPRGRQTRFRCDPGTSRGRLRRLGPLPGRAGDNALALLGEIDRVGEAAADALLGALDPGRSGAFRDRYVGLPLDLAGVLFVAAATDPGRIPPLLTERLEGLPLAGYPDDEKQRIAVRHLIPQRLERNGLSAKDLSFSPASLRLLIGGHSREPGVCGLDDRIDTVCRRVARLRAERVSSHCRDEAGSGERVARGAAVPRPGDRRPDPPGGRRLGSGRN